MHLHGFGHCLCKMCIVTHLHGSAGASAPDQMLDVAGANRSLTQQPLPKVRCTSVQQGTVRLTASAGPAATCHAKLQLLTGQAGAFRRGSGCSTTGMPRRWRGISTQHWTHATIESFCSPVFNQCSRTCQVVACGRLRGNTEFPLAQYLLFSYIVEQHNGEQPGLPCGLLHVQ
jgi:hypothetical protein